MSLSFTEKRDLQKAIKTNLEISPFPKKGWRRRLSAMPWTS